MEGSETIKKIIDNIYEPTQKVRNLRLKINKKTAENFDVKNFSIIINEYIYCQETKKLILNELSKGFILKEQNGYISPYFSKRNDEKMAKESKILCISKTELYRQLIYIYESGKVNFNLLKWSKYIKFNNI